MEQLISGIKSGLSSAELAKQSGLSEGDVEAVRQSPLVRLAVGGSERSEEDED